MTIHQAPFLKLVYSRPGPERGPERAAARRKNAQANSVLASGTGEVWHGHSGDNPHFKDWVEYYLQEMYADILNEPIPDEIMKTINKNSKKS